MGGLAGGWSIRGSGGAGGCVSSTVWRPRLGGLREKQFLRYLSRKTAIFQMSETASIPSDRADSTPPRLLLAFR